MLRFRLRQAPDGPVTAEGMELTDGRVVVVAVRVAMLSMLYPNRDKMIDDWLSATLEWIDAPETT